MSDGEAFRKYRFFRFAVALVILSFITGFVISQRGRGIVAADPDAGKRGHAIPGGQAPDVAHSFDTLVFLHTNDRHFDLNCTVEFRAAVNEIRNRYRNVFLFDAGDVFVRHPDRWMVDGKPEPDYEWYQRRALEVIHFMNDMGYDALVLGNHELAYIEPHTRTALQAAGFPLLSANMEITTPYLPEVRDCITFRTGSGIRIAVLGLSTDNAGFLGIRQNNIFDTARKYLHLRDSVQVFLALTHIGLANDKRLAEQVPELDVIIGGHSHDLLEEAILVNQVLVAHAGGNPHAVSSQHPVYLGMVTVCLENGRVARKFGEVMRITAAGE